MRWTCGKCLSGREILRGYPPSKREIPGNRPAPREVLLGTRPAPREGAHQHTDTLTFSSNKQEEWPFNQPYRRQFKESSLTFSYRPMLLIKGKMFTGFTGLDQQAAPFSGTQYQGFPATLVTSRRGPSRWVIHSSKDPSSSGNPSHTGSALLVRVSLLSGKYY